LNFCKLNSRGVPLFWVYDINKQKWRGQSQPKNESVESDCQKMDHFIGLDPYILEKYFSSLEGDAALLIKKVLIEKRLTRNLRQSHPLINLIGLLAGRTQATRNRLIKIKEHNALSFMDHSVSTEKTYNDMMNHMKKIGVINDPVSYNKAQTFVNERKFKIAVDSSLVVEEMINITASIVDMLMDRSWMVVEAPSPNSNPFICSNNPVNTILTQGFQNFIPGFNLLNSLVTFPLSPNIALIGSFSPLPEYMLVEDKVVEGINWCTAAGGANLLYASEKLPQPSFQSIFSLQEFHKLLPTRLLEYKPL
jgi:hypothetical protein